jgi:hypothetical protein
VDKFGGIDLHSNNSVVVVRDDADRVVSQRRLPNDLTQIRAALAPYQNVPLRSTRFGAARATGLGLLLAPHACRTLPTPMFEQGPRLSTHVSGRNRAERLRRTVKRSIGPR